MQHAHVRGACMHESAISRRAGQQRAGGLVLKACESRSSLSQSEACSRAVYSAGKSDLTLFSALTALLSYSSAPA